MKFYKCAKCGYISVMLSGSGEGMTCCGEPMEAAEPNTTEGAFEKHIPAVEAEGSKIKVQVGEVEHPMLEAHFIEWIALETKQGFQVKKLNPGDAPKAEFTVADGDEAISVYENCNLHGLWKADL